MDIGRASARAVVRYAKRAFEMGLSDGFDRRRPRSSDGAMVALMASGDRWPGTFQRRLRAVYLAGFHIAKMIPAKAEPRPRQRKSPASRPRHRR
jgi:hypothetical protein